MNKALDLTDQIFGRLTAKKPGVILVGNAIKRRGWYCICECGVEVLITTGSLTSGNSKSCGCLNLEIISTLNITHGGKTKTTSPTLRKTYSTWQAMKNRCLNIKSEDYEYYGGRGIKIQNSWIENFENFLKDMGERPIDKTLDRIDVNQGYFKDNCRWANSQEQHNNTRANVRIEYLGETKNISEWARCFNMNPKALRQRLVKQGWSIEKSLTQPLLKRGTQN